MLAFYQCKHCGFGARVSGERKDIEFLVHEEHHCPVCECGIQRTTASSMWNMTVKRLTFQEFYNAVNGMGLPNETVTHKEPVVAMLMACKIESVDASEVEERCIINSVTLDNGVTLHFAASGYGAAVYKATRRGIDASSRTKYVLHEQYFRGPSTPKKHSARGGGDANPGGEVHRRVREDADASGGDDRRTTIPSPPRHQRESEGLPEVAHNSNRREGEWPASPKEEKDQEAEDKRGAD